MSYVALYSVELHFAVFCYVALLCKEKERALMNLQVELGSLIWAK